MPPAPVFPQFLALLAVSFWGWRLFGFILASLVTQVAVEDVHSGQRATRGSATVGSCRGGLRPIYWSSASVLRLYLQSTSEVLPISMSGRHLGSVDGWLCQIFTRSLGTAAFNYRASCVRLGVGFLLLRSVCCGLVTGGNAGRVSLRTASWGTQWGQMNWLPAATGALCTVEAGDWGCFGDLLPDTLRPFGGMAFALRRFGVGLLSGWFCQ